MKINHNEQKMKEHDESEKVCWMFCALISGALFSMICWNMTMLMQCLPAAKYLSVHQTSISKRV